MLFVSFFVSVLRTYSSILWQSASPDSVELSLSFSSSYISQSSDLGNRSRSSFSLFSSLTRSFWRQQFCASHKSNSNMNSTSFGWSYFVRHSISSRIPLTIFLALDATVCPFRALGALFCWVSFADHSCILWKKHSSNSHGFAPYLLRRCRSERSSQRGRFAYRVQRLRVCPRHRLACARTICILNRTFRLDPFVVPCTWSLIESAQVNKTTLSKYIR